MALPIATGASVLALIAAGLVFAGPGGISWLVRGEAIVTCPCKAPCPCRSNAHASQPHCENLSYVRVVEGNYGPTKLDGLEYVWAADECQGGPASSKPTQLYFRPSSSSAQVTAVRSIMTGVPCEHASEAGMKVSRIDLRVGGSESVYSIQGSRVFRLDVDVAPGPIPMEPLPALDSWSNTVSYARNITARIDDPQAGLKWDYSGRQANYRTFEITSDMVQKGLLLAMFRDDIGHFNDMHRSLIRELRLQVPLNRDEFKVMLEQVHLPAKAVPEAIPALPSGAIAGTVFSPDGQPRSGARVRITAKNNATLTIAVSNAAGRFFVARVPPGTHEMCATAWDGAVSEQSCEAISVKSGSILRKDARLTVQ